MKGDVAAFRETATSMWLVAEGWQEYHDPFKPYARCYYKQFNTPSQCHYNIKKPGIQVEITVSERTGESGFELELIGELRDETWLRIQNYSLPKDIKQVVSLIPRLIVMWEAAN